MERKFIQQIWELQIITCTILTEFAETSKSTSGLSSKSTSELSSKSTSEPSSKSTSEPSRTTSESSKSTAKSSRTTSKSSTKPSTATTKKFKCQPVAGFGYRLYIHTSSYNTRGRCFYTIKSWHNSCSLSHRVSISNFSTIMKHRIIFYNMCLNVVHGLHI